MIGNDFRHLGAAVGLGAAVDVNQDGAIELANAIGLVADRQFGAECGLEEAFGDLGVGERPALGRAPAADLGVFGLGGAGDHRPASASATMAVALMTTILAPNRAVIKAAWSGRKAAHGARKAGEL